MKKLLPILIVGLLVLSGLGAVALPNRYQKAEVQNVSENTSTVSYESRLESGELPYWLNGTILDGNTRVIITENGLPPQDMSPNEYDNVISYEEMDRICEQAKRNFINQYGIDPCPSEPEPNVTPTVQLPYISTRQFIQGYESDAIVQQGDGPRQIGGSIVLRVFIARDGAHIPININNLKTKVQQGYRRFITFNVLPRLIFISGIWDAGDCNPSDDTLQSLNDLAEDCHIYRRFDNELIMGLVRFGDHNGRADLPGFYSIVAEYCTHGVDHPKDNIAQHELSHNFNCPEGGWWPWDHGWRPCVMNYFFCWIGVHVWCNPCKTLIRTYMWRP